MRTIEQRQNPRSAALLEQPLPLTGDPLPGKPAREARARATRGPAAAAGPVNHGGAPVRADV